MIPKGKLLNGIVSAWFQWQALQKNISEGKNDERCQKNEQDTLYDVFYGIFHGPSFSGILAQAMSGYKTAIEPSLKKERLYQIRRFTS